MCGMSTLTVTSTTTTLGTRTESSRLIRILLIVWSYNYGFQAITKQGVLTLPLGENNSALHTQESFDWIAEAKEEQLFQALFQMMFKKTKGVFWKKSVMAYVFNAPKNINNLTDEILSDSFRSTVPHPVEIYYPKRRTVLATTFKERVYQGYLNELIYPIMTRSFIYANMASQLDKGTDKARSLLSKYLWKFYTHHRLDGYVLQIDIKHYYQTIPHSLALSLFEEKLPPRLFFAVKEVLDVQYPETFYAGSQMLQILGIAYLDKLDHFIKEQLHIRYYIRYQDDFLLLHSSLSYLEICLTEITSFLSVLGLSIQENKTHIQPIYKPFYFLGFYYTLERSGRIYMRVNPKSVKHERYILRKLSKEKSLEESLLQLEPYLAHIRKGNSRSLERRLITYTRSLYENSI